MAIEDAIAAGLATQAACAAIELNERRFQRWRTLAQEGDYARHAKPATVRPVNAPTPEAHEAIREAVARTAWADLNCRKRSIKILETKEVYVSHVAIWEYERAMTWQITAGSDASWGGTGEKPRIPRSCTVPTNSGPGTSPRCPPGSPISVGTWSPSKISTAERRRGGR
ncbi:MAG: hypothetical protein K8G79_05575 [bacterium]|uniref:Transposase n=1 Tax=Candidatus Methylomirabilis tolerans TaxID=3123416 RepID=A0AAJ1AHM7_9BACT|nr:hypothetical protein [Candidatus Methylomirabilis sp.]